RSFLGKSRPSAEPARAVIRSRAFSVVRENRRWPAADLRLPVSWRDSLLRRSCPKIRRPKEIAARSEEITSRRFPQLHACGTFPALEISVPDQSKIPPAPATGRLRAKFFGSTKGARLRKNVSLHGGIACEVQAKLVRFTCGL